MASYYGNADREVIGTVSLVTPTLKYINPLNAELNPVCHLPALLGAHHILHVSRIRVNFNRIHVRLNVECERELGLRGTHEFLRLLSNVAGIICFCTHLKGQLDLVRECVKGHSPILFFLFLLFCLAKFKQQNVKQF